MYSQLQKVISFLISLTMYNTVLKISHDRCLTSNELNMMDLMDTNSASKTLLTVLKQLVSLKITANISFE